MLKRNGRRLAVLAGIVAASFLAMYGVAQAEGNELIYAPITTQVNICGNTQNVMSTLNPAFGNSCITDGGNQSATQNNTTVKVKNHHDD